MQLDKDDCYHTYIYTRFTLLTRNWEVLACGSIRTPSEQRRVEQHDRTRGEETGRIPYHEFMTKIRKPVIPVTQTGSHVNLSLCLFGMFFHLPVSSHPPVVGWLVGVYVCISAYIYIYIYK